MIKHDGVDIQRIEYIDPVDGKVSILRVMQDGVQTWPVDSGVPNTPTGIQLSEYEIESELQIPTGITLREVIAYAYLLDDYPGAGAAYSLRKLRTGVIQGIMVRRDSDDQLVDVRLYDDPSKSIDLDSITESGGQTLGEWVGGASAYIFNWYDQSGNGNHASQSTEADQPRIINAGVLEVVNGKTSVNFISGQFLQYDFGIDTIPNYPISLFGIVRPTDIASQSSFGINKPPSGNQYTIVSANHTNVQHVSRNGGSTGFVNSPNSVAQHLLCGINKSANSRDLYVNNVFQGSSTVSVSLYESRHINLNTLRDLSLVSGNADWQEAMFWSSDQSVNREAIETDINEFYNIY